MKNKQFQPFMATDVTEVLKKNSIHLLGFPFDGTASFRKGAIKGPMAVRNVSEGIESYSPYLDKDLENYKNIFDLGDLNIKGCDEKSFLLANQAYLNYLSHESLDLAQDNIKIIAIGGEHSISYCFIKQALKAYPELTLIHLDAHADLRDGYLGHHYSHASIIRRVCDHFGPKHELIQYGIRSGTADEYQWMQTNNTLLASRKEFLEKIDSIPNDKPVYLTLDLDYFDPSFFPGTGTPEPGGEDFHSFISLIKILNNKNFIGCDVVELAPDIDSTGNSSVFAAKVIRELILSMQN